MVDVHLVTAATLPVPDDETDLLAGRLGGLGVDARVVAWDDGTVDWSSAPVTVVRSTWDYTGRVDDFLAWIERVARRSSLWNPAAVLRWNAHKSYLLALHGAGVPIVPTLLLTRHSGAALDGLADVEGWNAVVVKPAIGAGASGAGRFAVGDPAGQDHLDDLLAGHDVLVQPYLDTIETEGEVSIVLIDGAVSHAVRKRPAPGDFRVQDHLGGATEAADLGAPDVAAALEVAGAAVDAAPAAPLYARVDVVVWRGVAHVVELEVLEPHLFLAYAPASVDRFAAAIADRVERAAGAPG